MPEAYICLKCVCVGGGGGERGMFLWCPLECVANWMKG